MAANQDAAGDRGEHRGAHGVGTGADAHPWADVIGEIRFLDDPLHVELPDEPHQAAQRLLAFLGVTWEVVVPMTPSPIKAKLDAEREAQTLKTATGDSATKASSGGLKAEEMNRRHQVFLDSQEMTARCSIDGCDWKYHGTAGEGRRLAAEHRADAHPGVRTLTKAERKTREIKEARRLRDERDAGQVADRNKRALERMDAGEPQQPAISSEEGTTAAQQRPGDLGENAPPEEGWPRSAGTIGKGEPDATEALAPAAEPLDRVDAHPASSPSPRTRHTIESIVAAVRAYAADHDGCAPAANQQPFPRFHAAAGRLGFTWRQVVERADAKPAPTGAAAHKRNKPLDAEAAQQPASASSGPGVDEQVETGSAGETNAAPTAAVSEQSDGRQPEISELAGELCREPDGSGGTRAPEPPDPATSPGGASTALTVPRRDPIRTADIPYDADLLENEAAFLRARAAALLEIASGIRKLADLSNTKEPDADAA